jgi:crotonobetainyl-CoA:carnitine CoA-transferase CaiB-like acyl-CoA transferase
LDGIRVVSIAHFASGPIASQTLGDLGAEVIKVESPSRDLNRYAIADEARLDGVSPYFLAINKNTKGIVVDLKHSKGREITLKLIEQSDIVIENYRPGTLSRLGLGYEDAKAVKPDIIYCSISGYGQTGPWTGRPGQDLLIQATSGLASLSGRGTDPAVPFGAYVVDGYTALLLVNGALAALVHRTKTGNGQWVQVDMFSSVLHMCAQEATYILNVDPFPVRSSTNIAHIHQSAPYGVYRTVDGSIVMSLAAPEIVRKVAEVLGVIAEVGTYLTVEGLRVHRDEIAGAFARSIGTMKADEAVERLSGTGIWAEKVCEFRDVLHDPEVTANSQVIVDIQSDYGGNYKTIINPLHMSGTPLDVHDPAPAWGEHTISVLRLLGYDETQIHELLASQTAYAAEPSDGWARS